jgi:beta-glucosidase-like glycosyl hydrolase
MVDVRPKIEEEYNKLAAYFHVDVLADNKKDYIKQVKHLIEKHHIGGLIFMRGTVQEQIKLVNDFQKKSTIPLLIAQDAEWGPAMRLIDVEPFPFNMTLGAIPAKYDHDIEQLGEIIGNQLKKLGVHINFAPVIDINNNPKNPIINYRSFGQNKERVTQKGIAFMRGLQKVGILACAKHFPGHGDVETDSHKELPVLAHSLERLHKIELYPFKQMIKNGVDAIMTAHLSIPLLDPKLPTTLSEKIMSKLLKNECNFSGLVFADCMMMNAITDHFTPGQAALAALRAGVDIIVMSPDTPAAIKAIENEAIKDPKLLAIINQRVLKILKTKEHLGLHTKTQNAEITLDKLNNPQARQLKKKLFEHAITLVKNESKCVPLTNQNDAIALVQIYNNQINGNPFYQKLAKNLPTLARFSITPIASNTENFDVLKKLSGYKTVIIGLHEMNQHPFQSFGITNQIQDFIKKIHGFGKQTILVVFGNPYSLKFFGKEDTILLAYQNDPHAQKATAKALLGKIPTVGKLPVTASQQFYEGLGL